MKTCGCSGPMPCGCCSGADRVTPESEFNRPGLPALRYRVGVHATFLESMEADLSRDRRLDGLSSREPSDASIALLDAWATVGDVLTFYQERIANEGFIGAATERRSVLELGNLIGYRPRPGVSASVFVAYSMDKDARGKIPAGSLARSVPGPGEDQQAFETAEDLYADVRWNNLQVRLSQPATRKAVIAAHAVYLKGIVSTVQKGDPLFVRFAGGVVVLCRVVSVDPDALAGRTRVGLEEWTANKNFQLDGALLKVSQLKRFLRIEDFGLTKANATVKTVWPLLNDVVEALEAGRPSDPGAFLDEIRELGSVSPPRSAKARKWIDALGALDLGAPIAPPDPEVTVESLLSDAALVAPPSRPPRSQFHRAADIKALFAGGPSVGGGKSAHLSGAMFATLAAFQPALSASMAAALSNASVSGSSAIVEVFAVIRSAPFGYNAGPMATTTREGPIITSWSEWPLVPPDTKHGPVLDKIDLEREVDGLTSETIVAIQDGASDYFIEKLKEEPKTPATESRAAYGLSGKSTRLTFANDVLKNGKTDLGLLRPVKVFIQGASIALAEQPITTPVCGSDPEIELDGLYEGLVPGKWIIIEGERQDIAGTSGVRMVELLLIADVQHRANPSLPGDRIHTFLNTVIPSAYCYKRDTVKIYGNVVKATNGETSKEVLGNGDATVPFQQFVLKHPRLTYNAAPTPSGAASTLKAFVNEVEWHESDTLLGVPPYERRFFTKTADDDVTTVIFGDGINGSRVPTGAANLRGTYRYGIGKGGNVQAGQLTILGSKPAGVKEVTNPLRASGGADRDPLDRMRENAPLSVMALDRLVSVEDYASFARAFAGIGKAAAVALSDGDRRLVHVTIAGIDDEPIDPSSDLYLNLRRAMRLFGDPYQPIQIDVRTAKFLVLQAGVKAHPDYPWETMAPKLTAALLERFHFDRRQLGQSAYLSEALDVLQRVSGVEYVDVDRFGSISESQLNPSEIIAAVTALKRDDVVPARLAEPDSAGIRPAELAYFSPAAPSTIVLNQL